jgi:hypothetical protein
MRESTRIKTDQAALFRRGKKWIGISACSRLMNSDGSPTRWRSQPRKRVGAFICRLIIRVNPRSSVVKHGWDSRLFALGPFAVKTLTKRSRVPLRLTRREHGGLTANGRESTRMPESTIVLFGGARRRNRAGHRLTVLFKRPRDDLNLCSSVCIRG